MKLVRFPRAAIVLAASLLSVVAAAQGSQQQPRLNIPSDIRVLDKQETGVRKATAIVNGEVITGTDIDHRVALVLAAQEVRLSAEDQERLRAQVLRNLIDETLQIQAATQNEITVEAREVDQYYSRFAGNFGRTAEDFSNYLRTVGASERALKRQIKAEMAWQRLLRRQIEPFVNVGDEEVQEIIDRLNASRGTTEYRVGEIFVSATPETSGEVQNNAARIVQQVRAGASFPAYARQFSEASTAAVGGDLGWVRVEQLPAELANLVQQMPVGAVSDPIPVPGGFSIVWLTDSRQILVADPRDAQLSLMQMSIALPTGTTEAQAQERARRLGQVTQSMGGCGRAQAAAESAGAELISNDQVRVRDLPPALQPMLLNLSVGQATAPFGSPERVSVLILCGRDDPPPVTGPTPEQVGESILQDRVNRRAQRYLRDLRRDAVIDYR